jgi:hypothetical protein
MANLTQLTTHRQIVDYILAKASETTQWSDKQAASMLVLLADVLGDIGEANSAAINIAAREAFIQLSRRQSSTYAGARFLGIPIKRKSPAVSTVRFTNGTSDTINYDRGTPLTVGGRGAFLTQTLHLLPGQTGDATIEIGEVRVESFTLTERYDLLTVPLSATNFTISSYEVWTEDATGAVYPYTVIDRALTRAAVGDRVVTDVTNEDGSVTLLFGGRYFGYAPDKDHKLFVRYHVSGGLRDNNDSVGLLAEVVENTNVAGRTLEPLLGADDELPFEFYKQFGPILHLSEGRLSRPDEWRAAILAFPGVADCAILSQRDVAPSDPTWQLMLRVCVLAESGSTFGGVNPNPTSAAWVRLLDMLAKYKPFHTVQTWNPTRILVPVVVEVAVHEWYTGDLRDVELRSMRKITELFKPRAGILGRMLAIDDLSDCCRIEGKQRLDYVDYVRVLSPEEDLTPGSKLEYIGLRSVRVTVVYSKRGDSNAFI